MMEGFVKIGSGPEELCGVPFGGILAPELFEVWLVLRRLSFCKDPSSRVSNGN